VSARITTVNLHQFDFMPAHLLDALDCLALKIHKAVGENIIQLANFRRPRARSAARPLPSAPAPAFR
jgi:hypothetical protein